MEETGWLSPSGELYRCQEYDHLKTAYDICAKNGDANSYKNPDEILKSNGWAQITVGSTGLYHAYWERSLTEYQLRWLDERIYDHQEKWFPITVKNFEKELYADAS